MKELARKKLPYNISINIKHLQIKFEGVLYLTKQPTPTCIKNQKKQIKLFIFYDIFVII